MKRIKLKGWVLVVLKGLLIINIFFMACDSDNLKLLFIKTVICMIVTMLILFLLMEYGDWNED